MRAELMLMGRRLDMAPRHHRRILVVLIYATLTLLLLGMWLVDRWHTTGQYVIFATFLVNRLLLGGYNYGGLVKPFNNKGPRELLEPAPLLALGLRIYLPVGEEHPFRNDERELAQRDRSHYEAYQWMASSLAIIWLLTNWKLNAPKLMSFLPIPADQLLYGLTLAAVVVALTLPQALLLWKEPDLAEPDFSEAD
jgi:hypothetical protein